MAVRECHVTVFFPCILYVDQLTSYNNRQRHAGNTIQRVMSLSRWYSCYNGSAVTASVILYVHGVHTVDRSSTQGRGENALQPLKKIFNTHSCQKRAAWDALRGLRAATTIGGSLCHLAQHSFSWVTKGITNGYRDLKQDTQQEEINNRHDSGFTTTTTTTQNYFMVTISTFLLSTDNCFY